MEQASGGGLAKNVSDMLEPSPAQRNPTSQSQDQQYHPRDKIDPQWASRAALYPLGMVAPPGSTKLQKTEGRNKGETAQPREPSNRHLVEGHLVWK